MAGTGRRGQAVATNARRLLLLCLALVACSWTGCAVTQTAKGTPGTDLGDIRVGAARTDIEARLGVPVREWTTPAGVHYALYRFDRGVPGSASDAAAIGVLDVISLGLWEVFWQVDPPRQKGDDPRRIGNIAVAYDAASTALGVFIDVGVLDELPADGRAPAR